MLCQRNNIKNTSTQSALLSGLQDQNKMLQLQNFQTQLLKNVHSFIIKRGQSQNITPAQKSQHNNTK